MAGLFTDGGPLIQAKEKGKRADVIYDQLQGMLCTGPLVVMMNRQSASSAEIFASSLRAHKRALLVGDTTFGKGTAQIMLPLDAANRRTASGLAQITALRLFRSDGSSFQLEGEAPHILLFSLETAAAPREMDYKLALEHQKMRPVVAPVNYGSLPVELLKQSHSERSTVAKRSVFVSKDIILHPDRFEPLVGEPEPEPLNTMAQQTSDEAAATWLSETSSFSKRLTSLSTG